MSKTTEAPSYWWRDKRVRALHTRMRGANISADVQSRIVELFGPVDTDMLERLERCLAALPNRDITTLGEILDGFVQKETRRCFRLGVLHAAAYGTFPALLTFTATAFLTGILAVWLLYALVILTIVALVFATYEAGRAKSICFDNARATAEGTGGR